MAQTLPLYFALDPFFYEWDRSSVTPSDPARPTYGMWLCLQPHILLPKVSQGDDQGARYDPLIDYLRYLKGGQGAPSVRYALGGEPGLNVDAFDYIPVTLRAGTDLTVEFWNIPGGGALPIPPPPAPRPSPIRSIELLRSQYPVVANRLLLKALLTPPRQRGTATVPRPQAGTLPGGPGRENDPPGQGPIPFTRAYCDSLLAIARWGENGPTGGVTDEYRKTILRPLIDSLLLTFSGSASVRRYNQESVQGFGLALSNVRESVVERHLGGVAQPGVHFRLSPSEDGISGWSYLHPQAAIRRTVLQSLLGMLYYIGPKNAIADMQSYLDFRILDSDGSGVPSAVTEYHRVYPGQPSEYNPFARLFQDLKALADANKPLRSQDLRIEGRWLNQNVLHRTILVTPNATPFARPGGGGVTTANARDFLFPPNSPQRKRLNPADRPYQVIAAVRQTLGDTGETGTVSARDPLRFTRHCAYRTHLASYRASQSWHMGGAEWQMMVAEPEPAVRIAFLNKFATTANELPTGVEVRGEDWSHLSEGTDPVSALRNNGLIYLGRYDLPAFDLDESERGRLQPPLSLNRRRYLMFLVRRDSATAITPAKLAHDEITFVFDSNSALLQIPWESGVSQWGSASYEAAATDDDWNLLRLVNDPAQDVQPENLTVSLHQKGDFSFALAQSVRAIFGALEVRYPVTSTTNTAQSQYAQDLNNYNGLNVFMVPSLLPPPTGTQPAPQHLNPFGQTLAVAHRYDETGADIHGFLLRIPLPDERPLAYRVEAGEAARAALFGTDTAPPFDFPRRAAPAYFDGVWKRALRGGHTLTFNLEHTYGLTEPVMKDESHALSVSSPAHLDFPVVLPTDVRQTVEAGAGQSTPVEFLQIRYNKRSDGSEEAVLIIRTDWMQHDRDAYPESNDHAEGREVNRDRETYYLAWRAVVEIANAKTVKLKGNFMQWDLAAAVANLRSGSTIDIAPGGSVDEYQAAASGLRAVPGSENWYWNLAASIQNRCQGWRDAGEAPPGTQTVVVPLGHPGGTPLWQLCNVIEFQIEVERENAAVPAGEDAEPWQLRLSRPNQSLRTGDRDGTPYATADEVFNDLLPPLPGQDLPAGLPGWLSSLRKRAGTVVPDPSHPDAKTAEDFRKRMGARSKDGERDSGHWIAPGGWQRVTNAPDIEATICPLSTLPLQPSQALGDDPLLVLGRYLRAVQELLEGSRLRDIFTASNDEIQLKTFLRDRLEGQTESLDALIRLFSEIGLSVFPVPDLSLGHPAQVKELCKTFLTDQPAGRALRSAWRVWLSRLYYGDVSLISDTKAYLYNRVVNAGMAGGQPLNNQLFQFQTQKIAEPPRQSEGGMLPEVRDDDRFRFGEALLRLFPPAEGVDVGDLQSRTLFGFPEALDDARYDNEFTIVKERTRRIPNGSMVTESVYRAFSFEEVMEGVIEGRSTDTLSPPQIKTADILVPKAIPSEPPPPGEIAMRVASRRALMPPTQKSASALSKSGWQEVIPTTLSGFGLTAESDYSGYNRVSSTQLRPPLYAERSSLFADDFVVAALYRIVGNEERSSVNVFSGDEIRFEIAQTDLGISPFERTSANGEGADSSAQGNAESENNARLKRVVERLYKRPDYFSPQERPAGETILHDAEDLLECLPLFQESIKFNKGGKKPPGNSMPYSLAITPNGGMFKMTLKTVNGPIVPRASWVQTALFQKITPGQEPDFLLAIRITVPRWVRAGIALVHERNVGLAPEFFQLFGSKNETPPLILRVKPPGDSTQTRVLSKRRLSLDEMAVIADLGPGAKEYWKKYRISVLIWARLDLPHYPGAMPEEPRSAGEVAFAPIVFEGNVDTTKLNEVFPGEYSRYLMQIIWQPRVGDPVFDTGRIPIKINEAGS